MARDRLVIALGAFGLATLIAIVLSVSDAAPAELKLSWRLELCGGVPYDCRVLSRPLPNVICIAMAHGMKHQDPSLDAHCRPVLASDDD